MILITHQRSGSEWFLHGLTEVKYHKWEILGDFDRFVGTSIPKFQNISTSARIQMLDAVPKNRAHKIHFSNLRRESQGEHWETLLNVLQKRDDLYLLTRKNTREALFSFMIALKNNLNFHESKLHLTTSFTITHEELKLWYKYLGSDVTWVKSLFNFKEEFTYEDLLSKAQHPTTVAWDANQSHVHRRGSSDFNHLVQNYDEVQMWMNELEIFSD